MGTVEFLTKARDVQTPKYRWEQNYVLSEISKWVVSHFSQSQNWWNSEDETQKILSTKLLTGHGIVITKLACHRVPHLLTFPSWKS